MSCVFSVNKASVKMINVVVMLVWCILPFFTNALPSKEEYKCPKSDVWCFAKLVKAVKDTHLRETVCMKRSTYRNFIKRLKNIVGKPVKADHKNITCQSEYILRCAKDTYVKLQQTVRFLYSKGWLESKSLQVLLVYDNFFTELKKNGCGI